MKTLLKKEFKLTASILSYIFLLFSVMTFIPGYPILVSAFFVCLGIFQTFQAAREQNDILYTVMLPVSKRDIVKAKYLFSIILELSAFLLATIFTIIRMSLLNEASAYTQNAMMNANFAYLGYLLMIYAFFNIAFIGGFFKTGYKLGLPFLAFGIISFVIIGVGETLHFIPGLKELNATGFTSLSLQFVVFIMGALLFCIGSLVSMKRAQSDFEKIDL